MHCSSWPNTFSNGENMFPPVTPVKVTSPFGWRVHPITGVKQFHNGIDLGAARGTPVHAPWGGVIYSWTDDLNGHAARIVHIDVPLIASTGYAHLDKAVTIPDGTHIIEGKIIGYVGSSGRSTGPHLHFVIRGTQTAPDSDGIPRIEIDPAPYLARASSAGPMQLFGLGIGVIALAALLWFLNRK